MFEALMSRRLLRSRLLCLGGSYVYEAPMFEAPMTEAPISQAPMSKAPIA